MASRGNWVPLEVRPSGRIDHMNESGRLSQVIEELVPEAAAFVGLRHKPRDVQHLNRDQTRTALAGGILRLAGPAELEMRTLLPDVGDAVIGLDRREGIVCDVDWGERGRSEERGLPYVRLPDDPQLHRSGTKNVVLPQVPLAVGQRRSRGVSPISVSGDRRSQE